MQKITLTGRLPGNGLQRGSPGRNGIVPGHHSLKMVKSIGVVVDIALGQHHPGNFVVRKRIGKTILVEARVKGQLLPLLMAVGSNPR